MCKILFISPHLDDAVLSCGAHIAALTAAGKQVLIATVFTDAGTQAAADVQQHYCLRRAHDREAANCLGAEVVHLGYTDAPFRNSAYHNFSTLLFHQVLPEQEQNLVTAIARRLETVIAAYSPENVWFPLGVGGHIDHHIVYESSRLLPLTTVTGYYEELPYALLPGWNRVRLLHLNRADSEEEAPELPPLPCLKQSLLPFVKNYINTTDDEINSQAKLWQEWEMAQAKNKVYLQGCLWPVALVAENTSLLLQYLQQKCSAIACYVTEYPALFGTAGAIRAELCKGQQAGDYYIEKSWLNK